MGYETVEFDVTNHIATITLNRPEVLNAFNQRMLDEFSDIWRRIRIEDDVRVVVLQANGERAFCTGLDRVAGIDMPENPWSRLPPAFQLGPKSNHVFKPLITAVHGMCAGGAFYWVSESDIVICSDDAEFFDPHTSYGMTSPFVPASLMRRVPWAEALRMALLGLDERVTAKRAFEIGLVSEVVPASGLRARAADLAAQIAAKPPSVIQGTVKAAWISITAPASVMLETGTNYSAIGNPLAVSEPKSSLSDKARTPPTRR
ncbi:MAG: enoyl-CoA hydratase/isomerase family protein [Acidimicrobiia bacterium]